MVRPIVSEGFLLRCTPRGRTAVVCVLEANDVVNVDKGAGLASVEAYGGVRFVALVAEVFAVVAFCIGGRGCIKKYQS
jgi:hypothetical protein